MSISMLTAMIIFTRGEDIQCQGAKYPKDEKWSGVISVFKDGVFDHELVTSSPAFDCEADAV